MDTISHLALPAATAVPAAALALRPWPGSRWCGRDGAGTHRVRLAAQGLSPAAALALAAPGPAGTALAVLAAAAGALALAAPRPLPARRVRSAAHGQVRR